MRVADPVGTGRLNLFRSLIPLYDKAPLRVKARLFLRVGSCPLDRIRSLVGTSGPVAVYCGALERAVDRLGAGRMLFGSDFPLTNAGPLLAALDALRLSLGDYERITSRNSAELFGI